MAKNYDPKKVIVVFGGVPIGGYADGDFIEVAPNDADGFKKQVGADGEVARAQSADNTHNVTLTLMQSSMSNQYLSGIRTMDKMTGKGCLPLAITDVNGVSLHFWPEAWIKGDPTWGYGKELKERQWTFDTGQQAVDNKSGLVSSGILG
jgi:hypothetical protein